MSEVPFGRSLYPLALTAWLAAFGWKACGVAAAQAELSRQSERLDGEAMRIERDAERLKELNTRSVTQAREAAFLEGLSDLLPRDQGYRRTQKAIAGEVAALRARVGKRLGGGLNILVDAKANKLYVKKGLKLLWAADCSVGRGGMLYDRRSGRRWQFTTPRGEFRILGHAVAPRWRRPDWSYAEAGEPVPPPDDPSRFVPGELGAYLLDLGDGYLIHGTRSENLLGRPASHGCVRLGAEDLARLYRTVPNGTRVFIFQ